MFKTDEYVFHIHCGVCLVRDIAALPGDDSGTLYYVLSPLYGDDKGNIVRVPTSNAVSLRSPLTKKEAQTIIKEWPDIQQNLYIVDSKARKAAYEAAVKTGSAATIAPLLEGAYQRKARDGHLNSMDSQFVNRVAPVVYGELALALGIEFSDVQNHIRENAGK